MRTATKKELKVLLSNVQRTFDDVTVLSDSVSQRLLAAYQEAINVVRRDLRRWASSVDGGSEFTIARHRQMLLNAEEGLRRIDDMGKVANRELRKAMPDIGSQSVHTFQRNLSETERMFDVWRQPMTANVGEVLARGDRLLFKRFETSAARYGGRLGERIRDQLSFAQLQGRTIDETVRQFNEAMPRAFTAGHYETVRLVRTETMNAYNAVHHDTLEYLAAREPGWVSRWDASLDRACEWCASLNGAVVDTVGGDEFEASVDGDTKTALHPPIHPFCRCSVSPWRVEWPIVKTEDQYVR